MSHPKQIKQYFEEHVLLHFTIKNEGNTCYFNSIIQSLAAIPQFTNLIRACAGHGPFAHMKYDLLRDSKLSALKRELCVTLGEFYDQIMSDRIISQNRILFPYTIYDKLGPLIAKICAEESLKNNFKDGETGDSHEMLIQLIDMMPMDIKALFEIRIGREYECLKCGTKGTRKGTEDEPDKCFMYTGALSGLRQAIAYTEDLQGKKCDNPKCHEQDGVMCNSLSLISEVIPVLVGDKSTGAMPREISFKVRNEKAKFVYKLVAACKYSPGHYTAVSLRKDIGNGELTVYLANDSQYAKYCTTEINVGMDCTSVPRLAFYVYMGKQAM